MQLLQSLSSNHRSREVLPKDNSQVPLFLFSVQTLSRESKFLPFLFNSKVQSSFQQWGLASYLQRALLSHSLVCVGCCSHTVVFFLLELWYCDCRVGISLCFVSTTSTASLLHPCCVLMNRVLNSAAAPWKLSAKFVSTQSSFTEDVK